jgi:hypothetical protein
LPVIGITAVAIVPIPVMMVMPIPVTISVIGVIPETVVGIIAVIIGRIPGIRISEEKWIVPGVGISPVRGAP